MSNELMQVPKQAIADAKARFVDAAERSGLDWKAESMFAYQQCANNDYLLMAIYSDPPTANNFGPPLGAFRAMRPYPFRRFLTPATGGTSSACTMPPSAISAVAPRSASTTRPSWWCCTSSIGSWT